MRGTRNLPPPLISHRNREATAPFVGDYNRLTYPESVTIKRTLAALLQMPQELAESWATSRHTYRPGKRDKDGRSAHYIMVMLPDASWVERLRSCIKQGGTGAHVKLGPVTVKCVLLADSQPRSKRDAPVGEGAPSAKRPLLEGFYE